MTAHATVFRCAGPRDERGRTRTAGTGRALLTRAAAPLGLGAPRRTRTGGWAWPEDGWHGSVAHCADTAVVVLARCGVGVDAQEHRDRPRALAAVAAMLGRDRADVRDFAEVEAVIKLIGPQHAALAGLRLPGREHGWRAAPFGVIGSAVDERGLAVAVAAERPLDVRWRAVGAPATGPLW
ncbi:hypothetical protein AXK57_07580 [Tsukamurella pulmonis]|uniref:4'-phosphopantetheinyl transferase superfamily protein n=1 Tax=Tsukamurella pulmonis TaxID=47312 RepID=A0A1H1CDC2_9ACTN|nr:hypothetical protein [Tsukamurella pulmonis]KXO89953.1 hypothetical protein AXK56_07335 [Tsukamurella pulmonis]KXP11209.1 hypothetical protein AXK57_07580 [Tsukamurella pulmonis]SDQ62122.1 hypothetical protein SAMN04489765_1148 [Tsukamurella pulmonis]SUP23854.1 Uncharacterised protein [Tsukamurella pulmonis]